MADAASDAAPPDMRAGSLCPTARPRGVRRLRADHHRLEASGNPTVEPLSIWFGEVEIDDQRIGCAK
jgi:hypothetical protein